MPESEITGSSECPRDPKRGRCGRDVEASHSHNEHGEAEQRQPGSALQVKRWNLDVLLGVKTDLYLVHNALPAVAET